MCVVCTDWLKGKMTSEEALRALGEMIDPTKSQSSKENGHYYDLAEQILDKEVPLKKSDPAKKSWPKK